ncbi:hypothetical protein SCMC78_10950 [Streptomyces sp. CMC78]|uniref:Secreted protein n=1 Tax=Streptomyces sp. CMC78 TaxID=3231512 RepID=A0AB33KHG6_9ACTN
MRRLRPAGFTSLSFSWAVVSKTLGDMRLSFVGWVSLLLPDRRFRRAGLAMETCRVTHFKTLHRQLLLIGMELRAADDGQAGSSAGEQVVSI